MITKMFRFHLFNDKLFKQSDEESKKYIKKFFIYFQELQQLDNESEIYF